MTAQPNLSLGRGVEVINALASADGPVGSRELSRRISMEHTRVSRLLGTLAQLGLAERTADRKYRPGPGLHVLAANALRSSSGLLQAAFPEIRMLLDAGHGAALGVLWRDQVCYLYHGMPGQPLERGLAGSSIYPAEHSSIGMAVNAFRAEPDRRMFHGQTLGEVRRRGWALADTGTNGIGHQSLAVPIGEPAIAGLAAIPTSSAWDQDEVVAMLKGSAERIAILMRARE